jgi:hypothetical protein
MDDLKKDLRVKAGMIMMCERIPFGSDAALMERAAAEIDRVECENAELKAQVEHLCSAAKPLVDHYFNWAEINEPDFTCDQNAKLHGFYSDLNDALRQAAKVGKQ